MAVAGGAGAGGAFQCGGAAAGALVEFGDVLIGRGDDDLAGAAVEGDAGVVDNRIGNALDLHCGGDAELGGEDRGMRGRATRLGDNAEHHRRVQRGGLSGRKIVRDQHRRCRQIRHARLRQAAKACGGAVADVVKVGDTLGHVAAEFAQLVRVRLHRVVYRFGGAAALLQFLVHPADQATVRGQRCGGLEHVLRRLRVGVRRAFA